MIHYVIIFVLFLVALRLNSVWERRLESRRLLHAMVLPLYHYLGLLDHELQSDSIEAVNPLFRQAVLDHVTELRSFLLQPTSKDLSVIKRKLIWTNQLNNLLLAMEDLLESEEMDLTQLKGQVAHLLGFINQNPLLSRLISRPLGVVRYSE